MKAYGCRIVRSDGFILRATNLDAPLIVKATGYAGTYSRDSGVSVSAVAQNSNLAVDNMEISGALNVDVTAGEIEGGVWDAARVTVFEVPDISDTTQIRVLIKGPIGRIKRTYEGAYTVDVRNILQLLQEPNGATYSIACIAILGSGVETPVIRRCGVDLTPFIVAGTVASIGREFFDFTDPSLTQGAGWFRDGMVMWVTGTNAGRRNQVRRHLTGGHIVFDEQTAFAMQVGDTYTITPGCDHTFATCKAKFANQINFRGQDKLPGMDAVLADTAGPIE